MLCEWNSTENTVISYRLLWKVLLIVVTPLVLLVITVLAWIDNDLMSYGDYVYPDAVQAMGWVLEMAPLVIAGVFPIYTIYKLSKQVLIFYSTSQKKEMPKMIFVGQ